MIRTLYKIPWVWFLSSTTKFMCVCSYRFKVLLQIPIAAPSYKTKQIIKWV